VVGRLRQLFRAGVQGSQPEQGFVFSRPLVLLHSDDWGRVGVRDREGYDLLRSRGLRLGEHPYDLYTLETAEDVSAVVALLTRHRDSSGCSPCMAMNFCTANLDFQRMRNESYRPIRFLPLADGPPGNWSRPGLVDAYRSGISAGVFYPALHGVSHFCQTAVENALNKNDERRKLLHLLWEAETPYIYWRMPWIGYEYWNPETRAGFLMEEQQQSLIGQASRNFSALFNMQPFSACAPGYRANHDTRRAWAQANIRIAQDGTGSGLRSPHLDEFRILHIYRCIDFEPSQREVEIDKYLEIAKLCFSKRFPFVISVHSINFHSTLKDFRTPAIAALDDLLTALERNFPELQYVNDKELYEIVTTGTLAQRAGKPPVTAEPLSLKRHSAGEGRA
jgi:hypothetical protein